MYDSRPGRFHYWFDSLVADRGLWDVFLSCLLIVHCSLVSLHIEVWCFPLHLKHRFLEKHCDFVCLVPKQLKQRFWH